MKTFAAACVAMLTVSILAGSGCSVPPEQEAVEAVEDVGGSVKIDADGQVIEVDLSRTAASDRLLVLLAALPRLRVINCRDTSVNGDGLAYLSDLSELTTLYLVGSELDDEGLKKIEGLRSLQTLHLGRTRITDAGLPALRQLTKLRTLSLGYTAVTDAGPD